MNRPYLKFYVKDFLASQRVLELNTQEIGALLLMLFSASQRDDVALPNDDKVLAKICRMSPYQFKKISKKLKDFFIETNEKLHNEKLEKAVAEYDRSIENSRKGGIASGVSRSTKNRSAVEPRLNQPEPEPEPEPKPFIKKENIKENDGFKDKGLGKDKEAEDKVEEQDELSAHMLDALPCVEDLPQAIATDNDCTIDEANYMIALFVEKQRQVGKNYPNFTAAENHCIFWCRKRAKHLLYQLKLNTY